MVLVGSGFLLGEGPEHLPAHITGDVAIGKTFATRLQLRFTATNVTDKTYLTGFESSNAALLVESLVTQGQRAWASPSLHFPA